MNLFLASTDFITSLNLIFLIAGCGGKGGSLLDSSFLSANILDGIYLSDAIGES
jgi:hypothetical protein